MSRRGFRRLASCLIMGGADSSKKSEAQNLFLCKGQTPFAPGRPTNIGMLCPPKIWVR